MKSIFGKKGEGRSTARHPTAIQRVKLGTNCPVGNRRKTSTNKATARKTRHSAGTCQEEGLARRRVIALSGPKVTSMSATNSAMRSSDLRQTITVLTPKYNTMVASVKATVYTA